ncbi:MAG: glucosaminidase domain-containing protein [Alistipes sp.]|nr:glucosaminidase domain-containing protein [Alistipes sp.]
MDSLKIFALCLALGAAIPSAVPVAAQNISHEEYLERYGKIAVDHAEKYGIPASIKMAQGILESGWGNGTLARRGNTHFNIKVKPSDNWRGEVVYHDDDRPNEPFRAYRTPEDSWTDHSEYLDRQPRYDSLFAYGTTDYRSWARGLKNAGYATDPLYAEKLVRIIEDNELWRLDGESGGLNGGGSDNSNNDSRESASSATDRTPARREPSQPSSTDLVDPDRFVVVMQRSNRK